MKTNLHLSIKTVYTFREHIIEKLGFCDSAQLLHQAFLWTEESRSVAAFTGKKHSLRP